MMNLQTFRSMARTMTTLGAPLSLVMQLAACGNLLEVKNPNQLKEEDLSNVAAAPAIVNGALALVSSGITYSLLAQMAASDELKWVGSYDSGRDLGFGNLSNPRNEFTMSAFPAIAQGRWMADDAIVLLEAFDKDPANRLLFNRSDLARAYIYAGVVYTSIADMYDDFTLSDRRTSAPPLGEAGMLKLYDTAVGYLDKAVEISRAKPDAALEITALALRARTKHAKAVRLLVTPKGKAVTNPLVNDAGANADAQAFLAKNTDPDYKYRFKFSATTKDNQVGAWVNERAEFRVSDVYGVPDVTDKKIASVRYTDPITNAIDPAISGIINEFRVARQYATLTIVSAREIRLILAEAALAAGNLTEFRTQINAVRALDALPAYDPAIHTITPLDLLKHERRANLFYQGRRLLDMYRFRDMSPGWLTTSEAVRLPGILLPIADNERNSNCYLNGSC
jgi:hypothetical protein